MGRAVSWVLVGLCVVASAAPARADDYYVTKTADTNNGSCTPDSPGSDCSLREAIITANGHGGADRIVLVEGPERLDDCGKHEIASRVELEIMA